MARIAYRARGGIRNSPARFYGGARNRSAVVACRAPRAVRVYVFDNPVVCFRNESVRAVTDNVQRSHPAARGYSAYERARKRGNGLAVTVQSSFEFGNERAALGIVSREIGYVQIYIGGKQEILALFVVAVYRKQIGYVLY